MYMQRERGESNNLQGDPTRPSQSLHDKGPDYLFRFFTRSQHLDFSMKIFPRSNDSSTFPLLNGPREGQSHAAVGCVLPGGWVSVCELDTPDRPFE